MKEKQWYLYKPRQVSEMLDTHIEKGLTQDEVIARMKKYGPNELSGKRGLTIWEMLLGQFKDFLVLILIGASIVSLVVNELIDSIVILVIVILNAILGAVQESRANKALEALKKMAAPTTSVIRDGEFQEVPASELVPGDLVVLETGDYIPADLRLTESVNLKIEEASLTGESVPVEKSADAVFTEEIPLGDRANTAFMGTIITYGRGKGIVTGTGMKTEIGMIAEMIESYEEGETPLQEKLSDFGKILGKISLIVVAIVFIIGLLRGLPLLEMFMTSISLAVAAIPEGLPAIVTIVLALGMQRMIKRHVIIKRLHAVETLGSTTVIGSDKTGTLTQNEMTVVSIYTNEQFFTVTGEGYRPEGIFKIANEKINPRKDPHLELCLKIGALANDAKMDQSGTEENDKKSWRIVGDPTEGALVVAASKAGMHYSELNQKYPRFQEIPFDSDRKRMTTFHPKSDRNGNLAFVKGAPDIVINLCKFYYINEEVKPLSQDMRQKINEANHSMASKALRVLAVAYKEVDEVPKNPEPQSIEKDLIFVGLIGMIDPARPEAVEAINICKRAGIRPIMITGDYKDTAFAIAKQLKLTEDESRVMTGAEIESIDDDGLAKIVSRIDVFARVSPQHKMKIVDAIKMNNEIVAMTGDGVNDAPALKRADIGVAMGITGTDVAKETADIILTNDNFASIVAAVEEGRVIYSNIKKFIFFLLSCNVAEIMIIFLAMLFGWPIPLRPIQILWLNLVTDAFPALALGMEQKEPNIMDRPPRNPDEPILDHGMKIRITVQTLFMTVATLGIFNYTLRTSGNVEHARNLAFVTLITSELLRAYTSRSEEYSIFEIGLFSNKYMVCGTILSFLLVLLVVYIPSLRLVFETEYVTLSQWIRIVAFAIIPSIAAEITKLMTRKRQPV